MNDKPDEPPASDAIPAPVPSEAEGPVPSAAEGPTPTVRHDGWDGERMAIFCETLAETAIVAEACEAAGMGISGAYACRRRAPLSPFRHPIAARLLSR